VPRNGRVNLFCQNFDFGCISIRIQPMIENHYSLTASP
jgi:hypothetical protein